jgi:DNA primase
MSWVLSQLLSIGVPQAKELMNSYWGISSGTQASGSGSVRFGTATHVDLPGGDLKPIHKKYLKKRGFDPGYLEDRYHIRGTVSGDYKYRIIIPIYNRAGRLISYQGRTVIDSPVKYKGARLDESVSHYKHALYNINNCEGSGILVVEGVFDVWRLGDGAVCTFGTSVPDQQVKEMAVFDRIFLLFDPEPAAQKKARKIALKLASLKKEVEMINLSSGDPADMSFSEAVRMKKELGVG